MWLRVESIRRAAAGVVVLELADPDGRELPDWEPGSHLELTLPSGLVRRYSVCGPAGHPYSCLAGECGSCEVCVLEGVVGHRDEVLSDSGRAENSAMMLCVSRAVSHRLVIDL